MTSKTLQWDRDGERISDKSGAVVARIGDGDVMAAAKHWPDGCRESTLIVPCGEHGGVDPEPSEELLARWSADSWEPFNEAVRVAGGLALENGSELVILPGAGGRLSDAICTVSWSNSHREVGLLIDPVGWLTPCMMGDVGDHLIRFASMCEEIPNIWGVVVRSVRMDESGRLVHAPIGDGLIGEELLERTIRVISSPRIIECI